MGGQILKGLPEAHSVFRIRPIELQKPQKTSAIRLEEAKKLAIDMLEAQIKWAERRRERRKPYEDIRAVLSFPSEIALEKIMRYEAHLGREFDRTLQQIERLRRETGKAH